MILETDLYALTKPLLFVETFFAQSICSRSSYKLVKRLCTDRAFQIGLQPFFSVVLEKFSLGLKISLMAFQFNCWLAADVRQRCWLQERSVFLPLHGPRRSLRGPRELGIETLGANVITNNPGVTNR